MLKKFLFSLFLTGTALISGFSQTTRTITLEEAIQLGVQNSRILQADAARLEAARAKTRQYWNAQIPAVTLNSSYNRLSDNITPFTIPVPDASGGFTIKELNPQILNQYSNKLTLQEILFTGGKARNFFQSSEYLERALQLDGDKDRLEVQNNIVNALLNLYKLQASDRALESNLRVLKLRLEDVKHFVQNGTALENDRLKAELAISQVETARQDVMNAWNTANFNLDMLLGLPTETLLQPDSASLFQPAAPVAYAEYQSQLAGRPDLQAAAMRREASAKQVSVTRGNYFPNLFLNGNYYYNLPNNRVFPPENKFFPTWDAGISLSWNLTGLYTNKHAVQEAKANLLQTEAQRAQLQEAAQMELNANINAYQTALAKIELSQKSVAQSEENRRVQQNRFGAQLSSMADMLDADFLALQSRLNLEAARADAAAAYFKILKAVGK